MSEKFQENVTVVSQKQIADGIFDLVIGLFRQVGLSSCLKHDKIRSPLAFLWVVYGKKERTVHNLYTACAK